MATKVKYMDVRFVNPFIVAATRILKETAGLDTVRGTPIRGKGRKLISGLGVSIEVIGDVKGKVLYEFPENFAKSVTEVLLGMKRGEFGSEVEFAEMTKSAIKEIGNMISAHAVTMLEQDDIDCDISPPTFILGDNTAVISKELLTIMVPFQTKIGFVTVNVAMYPG